MTIVSDNQECPQCGYALAYTEFDCRTNERVVDCQRCGFSDELIPTWSDEEGRYNGYKRELREGAGALWYQSTGSPAYCARYFNTQKEVERAETWLRNELANGTVEAGSAYLSRWNPETKMVEMVIGKFFE